MKEIYNYNYLNNLSDIIALSSDNKFKALLKRINKSHNITVTSHLIHKKKKISSTEQFFFNLDNYISFLKRHLYINQFEIRIIINLTIYNEYNNILFDNEYYYSNIQKYENSFIKMFMYNYNKNIIIINKYISIKKRKFNELINIINNKKRSYSYFEKINSKNMNFYITIYKYLEDINL